MHHDDKGNSRFCEREYIPRKHTSRRRSSRILPNMAWTFRDDDDPRVMSLPTVDKIRPIDPPIARRPDMSAPAVITVKVVLLSGRSTMVSSRRGMVIG